MAKKKKEVTVEIPEYFTVSHYKSMGQFEHMDDLDKIVSVVVATTQHSEDEVINWPLPNLVTIYKGISAILNDIKPIFYPVFEYRNCTYGFQPLSKMSVGEWIDLETRMKDPIKNMESILAILYRPVINERFDGMEWKTKSYIKSLVGQQESLFKYYNVEEYDSEKRVWREEIFKDLPIDYALGAYTFFLAFTLHLQRDILTYSEVEETLKKELTKEIDAVIEDLQSPNTMDIGTYYETWKQESSLISQEQKQ